jgi:Uma2 family endonuclease
MSALPDLVSSFREMEALLEAQPEGAGAEIARGVFAMSPRPRARHSLAGARLFSVLDRAYGWGDDRSREEAEWLFLVEPEIRSEPAFSRLVPDIAGWKKSGSGWPGPDETPIAKIPEWVAEVLSPSTESFDRGPKTEAYGHMGVGWLWLVDCERRRIETFANVRGRMTPARPLEIDGAHGEPFGEVGITLSLLFL